MKLWGGRFETGTSEVFERFSGSLHFDRRLIDVDARGSQAYARALERAGILTRLEREELGSAFEDIRHASKQPDFFDGARDEDIHTLLIRKLKERVGPLADKIHTGRSRNEQVSLDIRIWLREQIALTQQRLFGMLEKLLELARRYPGAVIPGYTHLRRAPAALWAHHL